MAAKLRKGDKVIVLSGFSFKTHTTCNKILKFGY